MSKYKIKLNGLKDGSYINSFRIRGEFFETLNSSEIKLVDIDINTMLKVENRRYNLEIKSNGIVKDIPCDICTEKINIPISSKINYIIKKGIEKNLEEFLHYIHYRKFRGMTLSACPATIADLKLTI